MDEDWADAEDPQPSSIPIDALPDPVVGYELSDGDAVIVETNQAFESAFDPVSGTTALRDWLRSPAGVEPSTVADVCSSLVDGTAVDTETEPSGSEIAGSETDRYRLRSVGGASTGAVDGYLVLTALRSPHDDGVETDRIASVISHDLRNPLDVANAHLRAARETGDETHFDEVRDSHDRMEQIIKDVLTLARGENSLNSTSDVDVSTVATDAWATVDTDTASLTVKKDLPTTEADPDRLQRLFENLFRNAVEHANPPSGRDGASTDAGGSAAVDDDQPLDVRVGGTDGGFFVSDDGIGIPPDERERVFDPGYSSETTGEGSGLGLTIVERIADAHDWTVTLQTGDAGGARFEFRPEPGDDP